MRHPKSAHQDPARFTSKYNDEFHAFIVHDDEGNEYGRFPCQKEDTGWDMSEKDARALVEELERGERR